MTIALIAHDKKKELIVQFCKTYSDVLAKHKLCATASTGKLLRETTGLNIHRFMSGLDGGDQRVAAGIANNEIDLMFFFRDGTETNNPERDGNTLLRLCDVHNVPYATNIAMAEIFIRAIERGDFEWSEQFASPIFKKNKNVYTGLY